jgi:hypothetical protein
MSQLYYLYFPYGHPFLLPHGTRLTAFDTDVRRENTDVRWVGIHPPHIVVTSQSMNLKNWGSHPLLLCLQTSKCPTLLKQL